MAHLVEISSAELTFSQVMKNPGAGREPLRPPYRWPCTTEEKENQREFVHVNKKIYKVYNFYK